MKLLRESDNEKSLIVSSVLINCFLFTNVFLLVWELFVFCCMLRSLFYVSFILTEKSTLLYKSLLSYILLIISVDYMILLVMSVLILKHTSWDKLTWEDMIHEMCSLTLLDITAVIFTEIELEQIYDWSYLTQIWIEDLLSISTAY